tara:strand:- start:453 stop:650 length:198 start_codon:yes stop_codon:yes gene_type:complete
MRPTHGIDKSEYTNQPPGQSVKPILPEHQAAPLIQMQGLVELEVSYRWFRTCKDAEDFCFRITNE